MLNWNHTVKRSVARLGATIPIRITHVLRRTSDLIDSQHGRQYSQPPPQLLACGRCEIAFDPDHSTSLSSPAGGFPVSCGDREPREARDGVSVGTATDAAGVGLSGLSAPRS